MTFETEMDQFFARNCYSEKERLRIKACLAYRLAADNNDIVQAQETATQVLEGRLAGHQLASGSLATRGAKVIDN